MEACDWSVVTDPFTWLANLKILSNSVKSRFQAARNKMNPHNLAICFSPVLMLDTSDHLDLDTEPSIVQQLQILKYLIEIWPKSQEGLWHDRANVPER